MKQAIFILCLCVAITAGFDDVVEKLAHNLWMSETDIRICLNKTNVNITDLNVMHELLADNLERLNINNSARKVGCLLVCMLQKKEWMIDTHINMDKIKEEMAAKVFADDRRTATEINLGHQILKILPICIDRVKSKTNECEMILHMSLCMVRLG